MTKNALSTARDKPTPDGNSPEGRRLLLENGFEPLLIKGKSPCVGRNWQRTEITTELLASWEAEFGSQASGTGLRTGELAVVDIDLWEPEQVEAMADAVQAVLGLTDFKRIGAKGVQLLYWNPNPLRKITIAGSIQGGPPEDSERKRSLVEFMGQGGQIAAFGIHPGTGQPFNWPLSSPLESRLEELPKVTPEELRRAASVVKGKLKELGAEDFRLTGHTYHRSRKIDHAREQVPITPEMLRDMLAHVDPACGGDRNAWIGWLAVINEAPLVDINGVEVKDFERLALADQWSAGELSADHDPGGYYKGFDMTERAMESFSDDYSGQRRGLGSLVEEARRNGYNGPTLAYPEEELAAVRVSKQPAIERLAKARGLQVVGGTGSQPVANDDSPAGNRWPSLIYRGDAIASIKPPVPIIPGYLLSKGVTAALATRGHGKTVLISDMALRVASDMDWCGERVMPGWHVVYLCGEDAENTAAHIQAWCQRHNGGKTPARFTFVSDVPNLLAHGNYDVDSLIQTICPHIPEGARVLWIVDTWQRATTDGGQNEDEKMKPAFRNLEAMARSFDGAAIGCFHPPKDNAKTISGVAFQENATVGIWHIEKTEPDNVASERKFTVSRLKGRGEGNFKLFQFDEIELGEPDSVFRQTPTGAVARHVGGTGESTERAIERAAAQRESERDFDNAVFSIVAGLLEMGERVLNHNNPRSDAVQLADVVKAVTGELGAKMKAKEVAGSFKRLSEANRLKYRRSDWAKRIEAGFYIPKGEVREDTSEKA
ncbi:MAG: AAA family ATPase [Rhodovibrionaceae bacterium]